MTDIKKEAKAELTNEMIEKMNFRQRFLRVKKETFDSLNNESTNKIDGSKGTGYYSLKSIYNALNPALIKYNIDIELSFTKTTAIIEVYDCLSEFIKKVIIDIEGLPDIKKLPMMKNEVQTRGSIWTYLRRYTLTIILGLPSTDLIDDEKENQRLRSENKNKQQQQNNNNNNNNQRSQQQKPQQQPQQKSQPQNVNKPKNIISTEDQKEIIDLAKMYNVTQEMTLYLSSMNIKSSKLIPTGLKTKIINDIKNNLYITPQQVKYFHTFITNQCKRLIIDKEVATKSIKDYYKLKSSKDIKVYDFNMIMDSITDINNLNKILKGDSINE